MLIARSKADFVEGRGVRPDGFRCLAASLVGKLHHFLQELRYIGQFLALLGREPDLLQQLADLDTLGGGDGGGFHLEHHLADGFALQLLGVEGLASLVLRPDQPGHQQHLQAAVHGVTRPSVG